MRHFGIWKELSNWERRREVTEKVASSRGSQQGLTLVASPSSFPKVECQILGFSPSFPERSSDGLCSRNMEVQVAVAHRPGNVIILHPYSPFRSLAEKPLLVSISSFLILLTYAAAASPYGYSSSGQKVNLIPTRSSQPIRRQV